MAIKYIENRAFCAFIHTNTYHVGTLIKRFRQFVSQKFFIEISSIPTLKCPIRTKLSKILLCSSMTCLSVQGDLKLNFYEDCTSNLKTALFFWSQLISTEGLSILHWDLHCNKRDGTSSLIYNRRPPPLSFLSYLYGLVKPSNLNWTKGIESSSFASEIRKMLTFLSRIYL